MKKLISICLSLSIVFASFTKTHDHDYESQICLLTSVLKGKMEGVNETTVRYPCKDGFKEENLEKAVKHLEEYHAQMFYLKTGWQSSPAKMSIFMITQDQSLLESEKQQIIAEYVKQPGVIFEFLMEIWDNFLNYYDLDQSKEDFEQIKQNRKEYIDALKNRDWKAINEARTKKLSQEEDFVL